MAGRLNAAGKLGYAAVFVIVLPALLVAWAHATRDAVPFPALHLPLAGAVLAGLGTVLLAGGWWALWALGGGLPMNAFPPPRYVTGGVYALAPHPIYTGFIAIVLGVALITGSASGLWMITPVAILACAALVLGYERHDLTARFGANPVRAGSWLAPAPAEVTGPSLRARLGAYGAAIVPWCVLYEAVAWLGLPPDARSTALPFETRWPVAPEAEVVYASVYLLVLATPFLCRRAIDLRRFVIRALLASALVFPLYILVPLIAPPRPFVAHGLLGRLLEAERAFDTPGEAFPSFHVIWAVLVAAALARSFPRARGLAWGWALLVAVSCLATGMHTIADVLAGCLCGALVCHTPRVWELLRRLTETLANSWRELRIGPMRVISHGLWAALAGGGGVFIVVALVGKTAWPAAMATAGLGLIGAAVWGQLVERSPLLLRPYGFYGGLLGVVAGTLAAPLFGVASFTLLAAYCVACPVVQSLGRVRCLVQGCCHGAPAEARVGICYRHPRSRVVRMSTLGGVPVHPTPLYSILWNVVVGAVLARMWSRAAPAHMIVGVYLMLGGVGRFVEEAYRGEPQTRIVAGLRLYQWAALISLVAGAIVTSVGVSARAGGWQVGSAAALAGVACGIVIGGALAIDFPGSTKPLSRLT